MSQQNLMGHPVSSPKPSPKFTIYSDIQKTKAFQRLVPLYLAFVYVQFVHYIEIIVMILIIFFKMQQLIFLSSLHTNYAYNNSILEQYTHQIRFFLQDVGTTIVGFPVSVKF